MYNFNDWEANMLFSAIKQNMSFFLSKTYESFVPNPCLQFGTEIKAYCKNL